MHTHHLVPKRSQGQLEAVCSCPPLLNYLRPVSPHNRKQRLASEAGLTVQCSSKVLGAPCAHTRAGPLCHAAKEGRSLSQLKATWTQSLKRGSRRTGLRFHREYAERAEPRGRGQQGLQNTPTTLHSSHRPGNEGAGGSDPHASGSCAGGSSAGTRTQLSQPSPRRDVQSPGEGRPQVGDPVLT